MLFKTCLDVFESVCTSNKISFQNSAAFARFFMTRKYSCVRCQGKGSLAGILSIDVVTQGCHGARLRCGWYNSQRLTKMPEFQTLENLSPDQTFD